MNFGKWIALFISIGGATLVAPSAFSAPHCSSTELSDSDRRACERPWTLLVYMAAENNLSPYALWDLKEMESIGSTNDIDIVVQVDLPGKDGLSRIRIEKSRDRYNEKNGLEHYEKLTLKDIDSPVLKTIPEQTTDTEEARLKSFMSWGLKAYPSKNVAAVIWGHGQGWMGTSIRTRTDRLGGIGINETTGKKLSVPGLKRALNSSTRESRAGKRFDVLISDACLMQMAEVITELRQSARFLIGSSQNQDYLGIPYRKLITVMTSKVVMKQDAPFETAKRIPDFMKSFFEKSVRLGHASRSRASEMGMSAVNTDEWTNEVLPAFKSLSDAFRSEWTSEMAIKLGFSAATRASTRYESGGIEWGTWLRAFQFETRDKLRGTTSQLPLRIQNMSEALDKAVSAYAVGKENQEPGKRSISIWIPAHSQELKERLPDFEKSELYKMTGFGEVLKLSNAR